MRRSNKGIDVMKDSSLLQKDGVEDADAFKQEEACGDDPSVHAREVDGQDERGVKQEYNEIMDIEEEHEVDLDMIVTKEEFPPDNEFVGADTKGNANVIEDKRFIKKANSVQDILEAPFSSRIYQEKLEIVNGDKPKPALCNLLCMCRDKRGEYKRYFSILQYENVEWLTGCEVMSKLFCWPCLLFSTECGVWNKQGYSDLNHLPTAVIKHERSQVHIQAFFDYKMFGRQRINTFIDSQQEDDVRRHNEQVKRNREILKRIVDAVCYLSNQELPLKGHDESSRSANRGYYIELLNLLRDYDSLLNTYLTNSTVFQGTSPVVLNDITQAMSRVVLNYIKKEISSASFVAIIINETSDVMSKSQLSTVLRFVHKGKVHERFIGFTDVSSNRTSDGLFKYVMKVVEDFHIQGKFVGQTYDGATVMSGHINGLQRKVLDKYPLAIFTPCHAHVLNLVLQQSLYSIKECRLFFQTLSGLAVFFSKFSKRVQFVGRKLPSVAPTRWNFTSRWSNTVQKYTPQFIDFFQDIMENSEDWDNDTTVKAQGFLCFLQQFQTVLLLEIFSKLFGYTDDMYNILQSCGYDVLDCCKKRDNTLQQLKHEREHGFEDLWASAISRNSNNEDQRYKRHRLSEGDAKISYIGLYQDIVDNMYLQIECRYSSLSMLEFFQLLWHEKFERYKHRFPEHLLTKLQDVYGSFFDYPRLKNELIVLYACPKFSKKNVCEIFELMVAKNLTSSFKEVFRLTELILTIPSSTASLECTISPLKRINTCYRGSHIQERLSSLSLLSIENSILMQLKERGSLYDEIIEQYTSQSKRIDLMYK